MEKYPIYLPQFYTATILEWKPLLKPDKYKDIIIQCLQYLTTNKKITLYGFVIMDNHPSFNMAGITRQNAGANTT